MRAVARRNMFHSSLYECQWSFHIAPLSIVTTVAAMVLLMGKFVGSTTLTVPPGDCLAACAENWWVED